MASAGEPAATSLSATKERCMCRPMDAHGDEQEISANVGLAGVACGNGVYVAVGVDGTIVRSSDGTTWTVSTAPVDKNLYHITWSNGRFVAVGQDGAIITSADGITWQDRTFAAREDLYGIAWARTSSSPQVADPLS